MVVREALICLRASPAFLNIGKATVRVCPQPHLRPYLLRRARPSVLFAAHQPEQASRLVQRYACRKGHGNDVSVVELLKLLGAS